ncbi:iron complex outermembrane receptor protein [Granulicella aggregans]|uniref:Iron complex outermembrane receptor protein n=1 Tax=Granulicella aggregans TaxID=474949 RepID=A0A7W8E2S5_9BACT|nr:iron complex outermembrane receptor protein [Granulicella aggregans]
MKQIAIAAALIVGISAGICTFAEAQSAQTSPAAAGAPAGQGPGGQDPGGAAGQPASGTTPAPQQKVSATDEVTVTAEGETRDVQSIGSKLLLETTPGTSPIAVLAHLPSVSMTSSDPYGAYEWAVRISVRGFSQNQLGFTLDDVPLGDMSYGNLNGLHISRALIDENLGRAVLSQGTGALDTASTSNLGGAIQFYSTDPSEKRGFHAQQSFGSFSGSRTFARYDSGMLSTHTKLFVDGVYQTSDKWRGDGPIRQSYFQFNTKVQQMIGSKGVLTFYADYSNRQEVDYQDENKLWVHQFGYKTDNFGDWNVALQAANAYNAQGNTGFTVFSSIPTVFPGSIPSIQSKYGDLSNDPEDVGYYAAGGLRKDFLGYVKYETAITSHLTSKTTIYGHHNNGVGLWWTPYLPTFDPSGVQISPISERTSEYRIARGGVMSTLAYETGKNKLEGGFWFEKESFDLARRFYGTTLQSPGQSVYDVPKNPFWTQWAYNFPTNLFQVHLQDEYHITPSVAVAAGFKTSETYTTGTLVGFNQGIDLAPTDTTSNYAQGKLTSGKPFLPQVGVNWKIAKGNEVFADVAENTRAFQAGGKGFGTSPWGTTQAGFNALTSNLKAESSWSEEGGFRHTDKFVQAQASYFHVNFHDRLLAIQQGPGIAGNASILSNVGGVTTNGVDGAVTARLHEGWTFYNSLTCSKSTYDSNYTPGGAGGTPVLTGGKVVVDAPEFLYKNELSYTKKGFDAHIGSDFMGKRYFTYTDDNSVDGRFLADLGTSYHVDEIGPFEQLKLQFNLYNLANAKYYSTIGTNGFVASDPTSIGNNTLQQGSPRAVTGTFTVKF